MNTPPSWVSARVKKLPGKLFTDLGVQFLLSLSLSAAVRYGTKQYKTSRKPLYCPRGNSHISRTARNRERLCVTLSYLRINQDRNCFKAELAL